MKRSLLLLLFVSCLAFSMTACRSGEDAPDADFSTIDSNAVVVDSNAAILNIDNPQRDTGFSVALDSTVPTINPEDTNYQRK